MPHGIRVPRVYPNNKVLPPQLLKFRLQRLEIPPCRFNDGFRFRVLRHEENIILRFEEGAHPLEQFLPIGLDGPEGLEVLDVLSQESAVVRGGFRVNDIEDATFGDDEDVAKGLTFRSGGSAVEFEGVFLFEPGGVLSAIVGGVVGDDEATFGGRRGFGVR